MTTETTRLVVVVRPTADYGISICTSLKMVSLITQSHPPSIKTLKDCLFVSVLVSGVFSYKEI